METIQVKMQTVDDKVKFSAGARENPPVTIDYFPPVGTAQGYTSLELLMASFGSCLCTSVLTLLRHRMQKQVDGASVAITGTVRDAHPKALSHMQVLLHLQAPALTDAEVRAALQAAEEKICPVWAMIKGNVDVDVDVDISV